MAWIVERGGKHVVNWRTLAGAPRARTCPTKSGAKKLKLVVESERSQGRDWEPPSVRDEPEIEEVAKAYIEQRHAHKRPDTVRMDGTYLDVLKRFLLTKSKRPIVSMLSRPLLDEYMSWLAKPETSVTGKHARAKVTIAKFMRAAHQMWTWAEDSDRWPGLIPRPRPLSDLPRSNPQPVKAPTWAEMDRCVLACKTQAMRKLAVWLRYTGLRVGESMLFTWADIDMERGELTIRPEIDKKGAGRTVPLSPQIIDEIATWGKREGYLIPSGRHPGVREREPRGRDMARAWARAGVREVVWRRRPDHAFRRGLKSGLIEMGARADSVDYLQGHGAGSRWRYIDAAALHLAETVALIPKVDEEAAKVVAPLSAQAAG